MRRGARLFLVLFGPALAVGVGLAVYALHGRAPKGVPEGAASAHSAARIGSLQPTLCTADLKPPAGEALNCFTLTVPQHWAQPEAGEPLTLFVAIAAHAGPRAADKVALISGGPGQAASDDIAASWTGMAALRRSRDLIFMDQRGTGRSLPALTCPALDPVRFWYGPLQAEDVRRCLDPVRRSGIDLTAFDTTESAQDLKALAVALDLKQWNLIATSYGSQIALRLLKMDGARVRSVVLNSPTVAGATWLDTERLAAIGAIHLQMFADCAMQTPCARAFPQLESVYQTLARRLEQHPLAARITAPASSGDAMAGVALPLELDTGKLSQALLMQVGGGDQAREVPRLLWYLSQHAGPGGGADEAALGRIFMPELYWHVPAHIAYGLNLIIECRENRPLIDAALARASVGRRFWPYVIPENVETDLDVACPVLGLPVARPEGAPLRTRSAAELPSDDGSGRRDVPMLVLTGAYDTVTPTAIADRIAGSMKRAEVVRFRGFGHDVLGASACARDTSANFIETLAPPHPNCVDLFRPPQFVTEPLRPEGVAR